MTGRFDGDVLVVGTDAVALALACDLHRAGIVARVVGPEDEGVESLPWLPVGLRPPALEVLADLGVREEIVAGGTPIASASIVVEGTGELELDLVIPAMASTSSPLLTLRHALDGALAGRLEELGGGVDRGSHVLGVSLGGGGVVALERDRCGTHRTTRWRYVVDTSGAMLAGLGVGFTVHHDGHYLAAAIEGDQPRGVVTSFLGVGHAGGIVLPSTGGAPPVAVAEVQPGPEADLTGAFAQLGAGARCPRPLGAISRYRAIDGIADRFREGRVLLAGRAAHRYGHLDVQTTNFGLEDAHQLAWKLARVVRGVAAPALLDTHEAERRPVVEAALHRRARERRLLRGAPRMSFSRRDVLLRALHEAFAAGRMTRRWQMLAVGAPELTSGEGSRIPRALCRSVPDGAPVDLADVLSGAHFTLLALVGGDDDERTRSAVRAARRALGDDLGVVAVSRRARRELPWADWTLESRGGDVAPGLVLTPGEVILVRPDRRVAYAGPADPTRLVDSLGPAVLSDTTIVELRRAL